MLFFCSVFYRVSVKYYPKSCFYVKEDFSGPKVCVYVWIRTYCTQKCRAMKPPVSTSLVISIYLHYFTNCTIFSYISLHCFSESLSEQQFILINGIARVPGSALLYTVHFCYYFASNHFSSGPFVCSHRKQTLQSELV